jgi:rhodanese-related sulfurtransferase
MIRLVYGDSANSESAHRLRWSACENASEDAPMLELRPNCECCGKDLPAAAPDALICSFECTFCAACVAGPLNGRRPNCGGAFAPRPVRPPEKLKTHPQSAVRVFRPPGRTVRAPRHDDARGATMTSHVSATPFADPAETAARYADRLRFETDCWDVHDTMARAAADFVLLDVRGPTLFATSHIPGAINLPHGKMTERRMAEWPAGTLFVVYCAGPHCNGTDKAALRLGRLGRSVKVMIGGMTGWADEGFPFAGGEVIKDP